MITADQLNDLARRAAKDSTMHGYKDNEFHSSRILIKAACEVAEVIEAKRRGKIAHIEDYEQKINFSRSVGGTLDARGRENAFILEVKDTIQDEMADIVIYILVAIGHFSRGKYTQEHIDRCSMATKSFEKFFSLEQDFVNRAGEVMKFILKDAPDMLECILLVEAWLKRETGEDIWYFVREKMEFNKKRPYLHGFRTNGLL